MNVKEKASCKSEIAGPFNRSETIINNNFNMFLLTLTMKRTCSFCKSNILHHWSLFAVLLLKRHHEPVRFITAGPFHCQSQIMRLLKHWSFKSCLLFFQIIAYFLHIAFLLGHFQSPLLFCLHLHHYGFMHSAML